MILNQLVGVLDVKPNLTKEVEKTITEESEIRRGDNGLIEFEKALKKFKELVAKGLIKER